MSPRARVFISVLLCSTILAACGPSKEELAAKAASEKAERERLAMEERLTVEQQFRQRDPQQVLVDCKQAILEAARARYKPFEPFFVDSYSADSLQAATHRAGGKVASGDDIPRRAKRFQEEMKAMPDARFQHLLLDTSFSIMVSEDSFSGPTRRSIQARCDFEPGLRIVARI